MNVRGGGGAPSTGISTGNHPHRLVDCLQIPIKPPRPELHLPRRVLASVPSIAILYRLSSVAHKLYKLTTESLEDIELCALDTWQASNTEKTLTNFVLCT